MLAALVGKSVHGLQDQHFEHEYAIIRQPAALRSIGAGNRGLEIGTENFKINQALDALEIVSLGGQLPQTLVNVEKPRTPTRHVRAPLRRPRIESGQHRFGYSFWRRPTGSCQDREGREAAALQDVRGAAEPLPF